MFRRKRPVQHARWTEDTTAPTEPTPEALARVRRSVAFETAMQRMTDPVSTEVITTDYLHAVGAAR